jgi:hypothetical protein
LSASQQAFLANSEKALLDLIYLQPRSDSREYLHSLRLQNLERLDVEKIDHLVKRSGSPKLGRAVRLINELIQAESHQYLEL